MAFDHKLVPTPSRPLQLCPPRSKPPTNSYLFRVVPTSQLLEQENRKMEEKLAEVKALMEIEK